MTSVEQAHSAPPRVELEAAGRDRDIPLVVVDLEGGAIARSMVRTLAAALASTNGAYWLRIIAAGGPGADAWVERVLVAARPRGTFQPVLSYEAALGLRQRLDVLLDVAETQCRRDGCEAIGLFDGLCAGHDEALDRLAVVTP